MSKPAPEGLLWVFSSILSRHTSLEVCSNLEDLISRFMCVQLKLELNSARQRPTGSKFCPPVKINNSLAVWLYSLHTVCPADLLLMFNLGMLPYGQKSESGFDNISQIYGDVLPNAPARRASEVKFISLSAGDSNGRIKQSSLSELLLFYRLLEHTFHAHPTVHAVLGRIFLWVCNNLMIVHTHKETK